MEQLSEALGEGRAGGGLWKIARRDLCGCKWQEIQQNGGFNKQIFFSFCSKRLEGSRSAAGIGLVAQGCQSWGLFFLVIGSGCLILATMALCMYVLVRVRVRVMLQGKCRRETLPTK